MRPSLHRGDPLTAIAATLLPKLSAQVFSLLRTEQKAVWTRAGGGFIQTLGLAAATSHLSGFVMRPAMKPEIRFAWIICRTIPDGRRIGSPAVSHSMRLSEFAPQAQPLLQFKGRGRFGMRRRSRRKTEERDEQQK